MSAITPKRYTCYRAASPLKIDGHLTDGPWKAAPWTDLFVDIEGDAKPLPRFATRAAMLWDDEFFYFAADMEEPHVWGTLTKRDSVICNDNDFEIFLDPDGDGEHYMEFEINPLNAVWDLYLPNAYNKGGKADHAWDFVGIRHAVQIDGTVNCADDEDRGWTVEVAIPWTAMSEYAGCDCPPKGGDAWRVNFSRVEWEWDYHQGGYLRREGVPCDNWVWSPQGEINMHIPEMWGFVEFSDDEPAQGESRR
ncbi:MAG: carbohydrate-binding family 9-like protein [Candidatus Latescibacterota bacterium]|nr:carbohydrate-binding family 9-like protein [Candidatus Latescibacterota bacterium]